MTDEFTYETVKPGRTRGLVGFTGFSHSGKTVCGAELLEGAQRVYGGDKAVIDSEEAFGMYAADYPTHKHVALGPPHGADRWMRAIDYAYKRGARCFLLDTLSDEHIAMMEKYEEVLDRMAGDDWKKRERCSQAAFANRDVKPLRSKLERYIWNLSRECFVVVTWRADEKYTPKKKGDSVASKPEDEHTWKMATTSKLLYSCTLRWLLKPGADGVPVITGGNDAERQMIKVPRPFRHLQMAKQIDASLGEQIALLCKGGANAPVRASSPSTSAGPKFHPKYEHASGAVADSDPPTIDAYLQWLSPQSEGPGATRVKEHTAAVLAIYNSMLQGAAE